MRKLVLALVLLIPGEANAADLGQTLIKAFPTEAISGTWNNHTLNGSTDTIEYLYQCEEAGTITDLCYRYGIRTGTPPTYRISLQGVNTSGRADGTIKNSSNAFVTFTPPASTAEDGTVQCKTLGATYACTKGEMLATVIDYSSGTIDGSNNGSFSYSNANAIGLGFPHAWTVDAGAGTSQAGVMPYGYKVSSTYYGMLFATTGQFDFGSASTPDERCNIFTIPSGSCTSFKIDSAFFNGYLNATGSTISLVVYDGTTARQDCDIDTDALNGNTGSSRWPIGCVFDETYTFSCGSTYRICVKPTASGGTTTGLWYGEVPANGAFNSFPLGINMYYSSRTDAGSFTDTNTRRAMIDFTISDITASGGAGGLKNHNQASGGAQ